MYSKIVAWLYMTKIVLLTLFSKNPNKVMKNEIDKLPDDIQHDITISILDGMIKNTKG